MVSRKERKLTAQHPKIMFINCHQDLAKDEYSEES